jgi:hypothetical protein
MGRLGVHVARAQSWDRARQTARRDERERDDDPRQKVIRDSGARDARCPCGGGEPRFGTACFPRRAALARISHQDPGPCVPPARCATRSGPAAPGPPRRRGCALRGWRPCHAPCALDRAPPLTLRGATLQLLAVSETRPGRGKGRGVRLPRRATRPARRPWPRRRRPAGDGVTVIVIGHRMFVGV